MKHVTNLTRNVPARAESLLVAQQKVTVFVAFSTALGVLANSIGNWLDLGND